MAMFFYFRIFGVNRRIQEGFSMFWPGHSNAKPKGHAIVGTLLPYHDAVNKASSGTSGTLGS